MPNFSVSYMVSFSEKWNVLKNKETLSQKFMGTVKPDAPLKNRLDVAQKRLQQQIHTVPELNVSPQSSDNIQQKYANGSGERAVARSSPCNNKFF